MTFGKFTFAASFAASLICLASPQALAGTYGTLTYENYGMSVIITDSTSSSGNLEIPETIEGRPVTAIGTSAFYGETKLTGVTIPSGVEIGDYAFDACEGLLSVTIADGPSTIGEYAFSGCKRLNKLKLAAGTTFIGSYAFNRCMSLESVVIPATLIYGGTEPFQSCGKLQNVTLSDGITAIPDSLLYGCSAIKSLRIPPSITRIGNSSLSGCGNLTTLTIPTSVKSIGDGAFARSGLVKMEIPAGVEQIGQGLFYGCYNLTGVKLPDDLKEIGDQMFFSCRKLANVTLPDKVERIGRQAFYHSGLSTIAIPATVREIGPRAFLDSYGLESVRFRGNAPVVEKYAFPKNQKFKFFITEEATGFTFPKWQGFPVSLPQPEIAVVVEDGTVVKNGNFVYKFGNIVADKKSLIKRVTIVNVGSLPLAGVGAKLKGGNSSDFTLKYLGKNTLAPGKTATIEVDFSPKKAGPRQTVLNIRSKDKDEGSLVIDLKGTGLKLLN